MELGLISQLNENWLFRSTNINRYTARDIADLAFLYLVTLHILRSEFATAPYAIKYAKQTSNHMHFKATDKSNTDLYQFLNILTNANGAEANKLSNPLASNTFLNGLKLNSYAVRRFLMNIAKPRYDIESQKQILFQLETQLNITVSNYRSLRRLAVEWNTREIDTEAQKLTITRLLQALRTKASRGDVLPWLEKVSKRNRYELINVCNPETGKNCDTQQTSQSSSPNWELLKTLAAGALTGSVITHFLDKKD